MPPDLLQPKKMTAVLWDVMQADEWMNLKYNSGTSSSLSRFDSSVVLYNQIFAIHHTTSDQFKKSIRFYQAHPNLLQTVFDSLQNQSTRAATTPVADTTKKH